MNNPETPKGLESNNWRDIFQRKYGDDIIEHIISLQPNTEEDDYDLEFDFFYHKLSIIQSLVDSSMQVSEPTDEMKTFMTEFPLSQKEFAELHSILVHLREKYPNAQVDIPDALVEKIREVVDNFSIFSSLFSPDGPRQ